MYHSLSTVALPRFATVITSAKKPRQRPNLKTQSGKQKTTTTTITPGVPAATVMKTTSGFNSRNKEPNWQCIQNCGACCKLEKGPNFPTAEEIFDDPSDIEVFLPHYFEFNLCGLMILYYHLSYFISYFNGVLSFIMLILSSDKVGGLL